MHKKMKRLLLFFCFIFLTVVFFLPNALRSFSFIIFVSIWRSFSHHFRSAGDKFSFPPSESKWIFPHSLRAVGTGVCPLFQL